MANNNLFCFLFAPFRVRQIRRQMAGYGPGTFLAPVIGRGMTTQLLTGRLTEEDLHQLLMRPRPTTDSCNIGSY